MAPRTRNKNNEKRMDLKSLQKRREQVKLAMRKHRERLSEYQLEERRRKDRERYKQKKEQGQIKSISELTPRAQKTMRMQWKERSKRYRENKKAIERIHEQTRRFIENESPPDSPVASCSRSRAESGKKMGERNRRYLKFENALLKQKLHVMENKMKKYKSRYNRAILEKDKTVVSTMNLSKNKRRINAMKEQIKEFLEKDECSRLTAGTKETITRNKVKKQIRLLGDSLLNLYAKFKTTVNNKISYSLFCRYRPFWIISPAVKQRDTCLCIHHTNMELVITALKTAKIINEGTPVALVKTICCEGKLKEECLIRKCKKCKNRKVQFNDINIANPIPYFRWITKKFPVSIRGTNKLTQKTIKEKVFSSKQELVNHMLSKLPDFMVHLNNIYHQYQALNYIKRQVDEETALLHIDFAENYICKYAEEVQAVHFGTSKPQISLHTAVLYHFGQFDSQISPFCTISENLRHDPVFICNHLLPVIKIIKELHPNLKTMHFVSDGPSSQYRNKSMFFLMANFLAVNLDVQNLIWHFSEAGHGKGAPDGIGATVKRTADQSVARGHDVANYEQLIQCLTDNCKGIKIIPVDENNVETIENLLSRSLTKTFKGTLNIHQITWNKGSPGILHARKLSCTDCDPHKICRHYEIGVINTEPAGISLMNSKALIFTPPRNCLTPVLSYTYEDIGSPGFGSSYSAESSVYVGNSDQELESSEEIEWLKIDSPRPESSKQIINFDQENTPMVSVLANRSSNFYYKPNSGFSSHDSDYEEIEKNKFISKVFANSSNFTKKQYFDL